MGQENRARIDRLTRTLVRVPLLATPRQPALPLCGFLYSVLSAPWEALPCDKGASNVMFPSESSLGRFRHVLFWRTTDVVPTNAQPRTKSHPRRELRVPWASILAKRAKLCFYARIRESFSSWWTLPAPAAIITSPVQILIQP